MNTLFMLEDSWTKPGSPARAVIEFFLVEKRPLDQLSSPADVEKREALLCSRTARLISPSNEDPPALSHFRVTGTLISTDRQRSRKVYMQNTDPCSSFYSSLDFARSGAIHFFSLQLSSSFDESLSIFYHPNVFNFCKVRVSYGHVLLNKPINRLLVVKRSLSRDATRK